MHPFERSFKQPEKVPKVLLHSGLSLCLWPGRQPPLVRITTQVPREMDIHYTRQDASPFPRWLERKELLQDFPAFDLDWKLSGWPPPLERTAHPAMRTRVQGYINQTLRVIESPICPLPGHKGRFPIRNGDSAHHTEEV